MGDIGSVLTMSIRLSVCLSVCLSVYLSICRWFGLLMLERKLSHSRWVVTDTGSLHWRKCFAKVTAICRSIWCLSWKEKKKTTPSLAVYFKLWNKIWIGYNIQTCA